MKDREILVITNPASTNFGLVGSEVIEPLVEAWGIDREADVLETPYASYPGLIACIGERVTEGMVVVCAGGDGMANIVANAVSESKLHDIHIALAPYGNACDIARSINPGRFEQPDGLVGLLRTGISHPLPAIETMVNGADSRLAWGYFGVKLSAAMSERFADDDWRSRRPIRPWMADARDALAILSIAGASRRFEYKEEGQTHKAHELFAFTVNTLAKVMKLKVDPLSDEVMITEFSRRWLLPEFLRRTVSEAMRDGLCGQPLVRREITIVGEAAVGAHYDGEVVKFEPDTQLVLKRRKAALNAVVDPGLVAA